MRSLRPLFPSLLLAALLPLAGCGGDQPEATTATGDPPVVEMQGQNTIVHVAEDAGLTTFRTAVNQAGYEQDLTAGGPFTVFAPSDEAFNVLPEGQLESLLQVESRDQLRDLLGYHIVRREIRAGDVSGQITVPTLQGQTLTIASEGGRFTVTDGEGNAATIVSADLEAVNGVIHVIDTVLAPGEGGAADTAATGTAPAPADTTAGL